MIDRPFTDEERYARAMLAYFTPEKPFLVGQAVYDAMAKEPALADMMDRVKLYPVCDPLSGDVDMAKPEAWDFLRSVARGEPVVIISSAPTSPSWVRDFWDFPHTVIHESPPCAFSVAESVMLFGGEDHQVRDLRITVEKSRWSDEPPPYDMLFGEDIVLELKSGPLTMDEFRSFLPLSERELPTGRRYGPYDADPHMKGRRRRFRKQRRT